MSLRKQAILGAGWSFVNVLVVRGSSFLSTIVLAKILGPDVFGLLGMMAIFMGIGLALVDSGLAASLIRSGDVDDKDFSTVFYTNIGLSILVYIFMFSVAPLVAKFYNQEVLIKLIRIYCIGFIISALNVVQVTILTKEMRFKEITKYQMPATLISIITGVYLAYLGYGVWSLVWMFLANHIVKTIIFWISSSWRPTLSFDRLKLKKHLGFGYKLTIASLLDVSFKNIYNILIGKYYMLYTLGLYERSETIKHQMVSTLSDVIFSVSYPLLSKIQDKDKMIEVFRRVLLFSFFVVSPFMLYFVIVAEPLLLLLLGNKWGGAVPFFQILCFTSILYPLHLLNINLLKVLGRSDLFLKLEIYKKVVLLVIVMIVFKYGIYSLLLGGALGSIIGFFINSYYSGKLVNYGAVAQLRDLMPNFLVLIMVAITTYFTLLNLSHYSEYIQLAISALVYLVLYLLGSYFFKVKPLFEAFLIIKSRGDF